MKIRDFIKQDVSIDVYDDVCEALGICFDGSLTLTEKGKEKFSDVLDYEIELNTSGRFATGIVKVDDGTENGWNHRLRKAKEFFESAAGYCACEDWDAWFEQEV